MTLPEEKLVLLVKLHYSEDNRSFNQLIRNLCGGRGGILSQEAQSKLSDVVPTDVLMGNVLR